MCAICAMVLRSVCIIKLQLSKGMYFFLQYQYRKVSDGSILVAMLKCLVLTLFGINIGGQLYSNAVPW